MRKYFLNWAEMICWGLNQKGVSAKVRPTLDPRYRNILLGLNIHPWRTLPPRSIVVNMEQLYDDSPWLKPAYIQKLQSFSTWDYCASNQRYLKEKFGVSSSLLRYGFCPFLDFTSKHREDIWSSRPHDVLMFGCTPERRVKIFEQLLSRGIRAVFPRDLWGEERIEEIYRTKIFLNVHLYAGLVEIPRLSLLLNNRSFIISETCSNIDDFPYLKESMIFADYDRLVDTIEEYLEKPEECQRIAQKGYEVFSQISPIFLGKYKKK